MDNAETRHNSLEALESEGVPLSPYYTIWQLGARKQLIQQQINNQYSNK